MPGDPLRPDVSRLVLPRRPEAVAPPLPPLEIENDPPARSDDGQVSYDGWDGFDEDAPRTLDATPLPDVHLLWPLAPDPAPAPVETLVPARTAPCPGCGAELTVAVKSWCLRCGYDSDQPKRKPSAPETNGVQQAVVVLLFAALGCLGILAVNVFRREVIPDRTDLRIWWIGYQGAAGFLLYWIGHAIAVARTIKHWPDPQPSCFDPLAVWRYALYRLPHTRWAITYGLWGATGFACAFVLFWLNDFAIKDKTAKQKIHSSNVVPAEPAPEPAPREPSGETPDRRRDSEVQPTPYRDGGAGNAAGAAGKRDVTYIEPGSVGDAPRLLPRSRTGTAVVIGYVPDATDPNRVARVMLGTRSPDGTIRFAGVAQLDQSAMGVGQLRSLGRPATTPGYQLSRDVIPVEPKLLADIRYAEQDERGIFKDTVITGVAEKERK
ncbi:MAG TPA: hypothetical protein VM533_08620 [Fimbriiglobus sp.]|jgi:hypothetical protein|nr:hypothetical protein [Fimbriiglobus sp.]